MEIYEEEGILIYFVLFVLLNFMHAYVSHLLLRHFVRRESIHRLKPTCLILTAYSYAGAIIRVNFCISTSC
jgi:hypothetical protein